MKFIHLSDIHLGKRVNEVSMIDDQKFILQQIYKIIDEEQPDGVLIAGDIYDRSVPSTEAVELFDEFLVELSQRQLNVFAISGNHDSAERLSFGNRLFKCNKIYLSPVYKGIVEPITMTDENGNVNIYLLPFIKPSVVRSAYPEEEIATYTDAVRVAIEKMNVNTDERNILVSHQFVTGAQTCESETVSVGGTDNVDAFVFDVFDYTALGHIHGPQNISSEKVRYCGSPLKYSFSEVKHKKSVTVIELCKKGEISVKTVPLKPLRDMVELKGSYADFMQKSFYENTTYRQDYIRFILTDENEDVNALQKLRSIYSNIMKLEYDNTRTRCKTVISGCNSVESKTPAELFDDFYLKQNGMNLSCEQSEFLQGIIQKIWEGEE